MTSNLCEEVERNRVSFFPEEFLKQNAITQLMIVRLYFKLHFKAKYLNVLRIT